MNVERSLAFVNHFAALRINENGETSVITTASEKPVATRMEGETLDKSLGFRSLHFSEGHGLLPIEKS